MPTYKHMLLATSLSSESYPVAIQAICLAQDFGARLSLLHVVENLSARKNQDDAPEDMKRIKLAKQALANLGDELVVPVFDQRVVIGEAKVMILEMAQELSADLIVIAHREKSEASDIGSTALAVLQGATCDVIMLQHQRKEGFT